MADNINVTPGVGKTIAADEVGGALYQRVKLAAGADGAATDVSAAAPLPVEDANSDALLTAAQAIEAAVEGTLTVSGSVTVSSAPTTAITAAALPLPTGAATSAKQDTAIGHLATIAGVAGDALTDTELRATPVPVSGTVTVQDGGGAITVDGTVAVTGVATAANQSTEIGHLATLAGAVAGTEMQADIVSLPNVTIGAAIPAGTNNIGDVDVLTLPALPAGTNNIGDVDIASIAAGDNNIGNVDVASALPAGENLIGLVGTSDIVVTVTPTCDTNAYTSGDLLFDSAEIANAVRANGYSCVLQSVTIIDKDDQKAAMTLLFADAATDFGTLNSAPDPDDTEAATVIGWVPVVAGDYVDLGGASVACIRNIGLTLKAGASATSLYVAGITGGTPTHSASGLVLKLGILRS